MDIPKVPLGDWVDVFVAWLTIAWAGFFSFITNFIGGLLDMIENVLSVGPPIILILVDSFGYLYKQMAIRHFYVN